MATWAAAIEYQLDLTWTLIAESGGTAHAHPVRQIGARTWLDQDHLQLDASFGPSHAKRHPPWTIAPMLH